MQTYKINGEKAVHLNPRPQFKRFAKSSKPKAGASCEECGRHIQDFPNRFCSIACKVIFSDLRPYWIVQFSRAQNAYQPLMFQILVCRCRQIR